jgi:quercetin dioxygenase-like cupin family protein
MTDQHDDAHVRPRPHPQTMAAPYLEFDLARELEQLQGEPGSPSGHNAKTLVKYEDLRIVLMMLKAQARVAEHQAGGRLSVQTLRGHVRVRAVGRTFNLPAGRLLTLDRDLPHDVEALDDSVVLLTVAWPARAR